MDVSLVGKWYLRNSCPLLVKKDETTDQSTDFLTYSNNLLREMLCCSIHFKTLLVIDISDGDFRLKSLVVRICVESLWKGSVCSIEVIKRVVTNPWMNKVLLKGLIQFRGLGGQGFYVKREESSIVFVESKYVTVVK